MSSDPALQSLYLRMFADLTGDDQTFEMDDGIDGSGDSSGETSLCPPQTPPAAGGGGDRSVVPSLVHVLSLDTESDSDEDSVSPPLPASLPAKKEVSFSSTERVQIIPHCSSLSSSQRRRMYASSSEIERNKGRNWKEFRYDGCDWRNATEEGDMGVCEATGELVHPAHDHAPEYAEAAVAEPEEPPRRRRGRPRRRRYRLTNKR